MNTTDNFPIRDSSLFATYLANAESEAATQELLANPGLLERVKQNQTTPKTHYTNWRYLRSDV